MSDTYTVDGPSPSEIERAEDDQFAQDYAELVAVVCVQFTHWRKACGSRPSPDVILRSLGSLLAGAGADDPLALPIAAFVDRHGVPALLRVVARAMELDR